MKKKRVKTLSFNTPLLHLAIIMDGNRRWAKENKLAPFQGHTEGAKNALNFVRLAIKNQIKELSLYTFSTQNWNRTKAEVKFLMDGFNKYLPKYIPEFNALGVKVRVVGNRNKLSSTLVKTIASVEKATANNETLKLNILFNYGGDDDINYGLSKLKRSSKLDFNSLRAKMYSNEVSDVDLMIRTGGEFRISNFLPLQLAYSEFYFSSLNWPEFGSKDLNKALKEYKRRQRRFGGN